MIIVHGRCYRCGGNLFWDEQDGTVRCMACGYYQSREKNSVLLRTSKGVPFKILYPVDRMFDNLN